MRVFALCLVASLFVSCGVREAKEGDVRGERIVGTWKLVEVQNGASAGEKCTEVFRFNDDNTFWKKFQCMGQGKVLSVFDVYAGSYWFDGDMIHLDYAKNTPEVFFFKVDDVSLSFVRNNQQYRFVQVPEESEGIAKS